MSKTDANKGDAAMMKKMDAQCADMMQKDAAANEGDAIKDGPGNAGKK